MGIGGIGGRDWTGWADPDCDTAWGGGWEGGAGKEGSAFGFGFEGGGAELSGWLVAIVPANPAVAATAAPEDELEWGWYPGGIGGGTGGGPGWGVEDA